jgi:hypothetical protein
MFHIKLKRKKIHSPTYKRRSRWLNVTVGRSREWSTFRMEGLPQLQEEPR